MTDTVPDHSSLSKIRERFGLEVFQQFFEHIVELCIEARLVWGEELYFDSTKVRTSDRKEVRCELALFSGKIVFQEDTTLRIN